MYSIFDGYDKRFWPYQALYWVCKKTWNPQEPFTDSQIYHWHLFIDSQLKCYIILLTSASCYTPNQKFLFRVHSHMHESAISWRIHVSKPSTHVLTPPKLGALREVARDNIHSNKILAKQQGKSCPFGIWEMSCWLADKNPVHCLQGNFCSLYSKIFVCSTGISSANIYMHRDLSSQRGIYR